MTTLHQVPGSATDNGPPLPPMEYRKLVCGPRRAETFAEQGIGQRAMAEEHGLLFPGATLLDIGCGCGRFARHLLSSGLATYEGFDRHRGMIEWSNRHIAGRWPTFSFTYLPVKSPYESLDGDHGDLQAESVAWPYPDRRFDGVMAASVYTHMPWPGIANYLAETRRVLRPSGIALASFLADPEGPRVSPDGQGFWYQPEQIQAGIREAGLEVEALPSRPDHLQVWYRMRRPAA